VTATAQEARAAAAQAQRPAADPTASVWVAASAGTGKTKVLTDRVLSLMLHGTAPERILCLTFTKAAAAEMANRLAQRLAGWAIAEDEKLAGELAAVLTAPPDAAMLGRARALFAEVLDAPSGMKIQTIHAFCQSLLRRFPLEARIAPHFQVLDELSANAMLAEAREEVLSGLPPEDDAAALDTAAPDAAQLALARAVATVSIHVQEGGFAELMGDLAKARGRLQRLLQRRGGIAGLSAAVYDALGADPAADTDALLAAACDDAALDLLGLRLAAGALAQGTGPERDRGAVLQAWLEGAAAERQRLFDEYERIYLTSKGEIRKKPITKGTQAKAPGVREILESEAVRLSTLRTRRNAVTVAQATASLLHLGAAILATYETHKAARALLDYDDLILRTRDLLRGQGAVSWVLYKLDGGLDHILIDEAQDTNPEQWEVVRHLTEEFFAGEGAAETLRTVFAVGDAKQSIYSFQRADPQAFKAMREHFAGRAQQAGQRLRDAELTHSFRSTDAVLRVVDAVFAGEVARSALLLEEGHELSHAPVRLGQAGTVELWPPAEPPAASDPEPWETPGARRGAAPALSRLARLIARRIHRWTADPRDAADPENPDAWLASRGRWLRPGDILVLVRRRNAFVEELVRELKRLDVPVAGVDRMVLIDQLAVMDLVALGRVLLLPEDDLTLATVLKGPLIGLSEEQLFTLAYGREGSLWDALVQRAEGNTDFARAQQQIAALRARVDFLRPYELYAYVLAGDWCPGARNGRERLLARLGPDADDPIEEFVALSLAYEREHVPSFEGFLHWLEVGAQEVKRDMEHGQDAVRVMTVHGAKGLQAPIVFLPDTLQVPKGKGGLLWLEDDRERETALMLWSLRKSMDGAAARRARDRAAEAQAAEYRRLLYVALTRAEDRLYVCGWHTQNAAPGDCWYRLVEGALAGIAAPATFDFTAEIADGWCGSGWRLATAQSAEAESERPAPALRGALGPAALPSWAETAAPDEPTPPRPLAPSRPAGEEPPVRSPLGPDEGWRYRRGRLIHRLLQTLPDLPPGPRRAAAERYLAAPGRELDRAAREEIASVVLAVLESPGFAPIFGPGSGAEVAIVGTLATARGVEVVSGQVDRLVVTPPAVLVVDYKSNRPAPVDEAGVAPLYLRQMAAYRAVLREIYPDRRVDCALLWTDGPRLMQLSDAVLDSHLP